MNHQTRAADGYPIGMHCRSRILNVDTKQYIDDKGMVEITSEPFRAIINPTNEVTGDQIESQEYSAYGQLGVLLETEHPALKSFIGKESFHPMYTLLPPEVS